jgi:hypothetical protein
MAQVLWIYSSGSISTQLGGFLVETGCEKELALRGRTRSRCLGQTFESTVCEFNGIFLQFTHLLDASRDDGSLVMLKHISISRHPHEAEVGQLFSSEMLASNPKNRCVPFYDVLRIPSNEDGAVIVMPLLYRVEDLPFQTIGEVVEFFRQIFEVIAEPSSWHL